MRRIICYEGVEKVPGQFITKGALTWGDEPLPVTPSFDHTETIGWATDIRREDDGAVTAEIEMVEKKYNKILKNMTVSIKMYECEFHSWMDMLWITKGEIRMLALIPDAFWPQNV